MRKIRLDAETLSVESFTANDDAFAPKGTVHGNATPPTFCGATCSPTCRTNCDCTYGCFSIAPCAVA